MPIIEKEVTIQFSKKTFKIIVVVVVVIILALALFALPTFVTAFGDYNKVWELGGGKARVGAPK